MMAATTFRCRHRERRTSVRSSRFPRTYRLQPVVFSLLVGVLGWGVPTGILFALISAWGNLAEELPVRLAIALVLFPLGGILFEQMMWVVSRKIQNKTTESKTTAS